MFHEVEETISQIIRRQKSDRRLRRHGSAADTLTQMRKQVEGLILAAYPSIERFCSARRMNKATVSNFLRGKKDFQITTLAKIARALEKDLTIRLD